MGAVLSFLREVARSPKKVGAFGPSSPFLAQATVEAADVKPEHTVVELGAGTGVITNAILDVVQPSSLLSVEPNAEMACFLRERFPGLNVDERYAQELPEIVSQWGHDSVDRVVSGLPWTLWPLPLQEQVADAIVSVLKPQGRMVTFVYATSRFFASSRRAHALLQQRFERVSRNKVTWANVPPAVVIVCEGPKVD